MLVVQRWDVAANNENVLDPAMTRMKGSVSIMAVRSVGRWLQSAQDGEQT